MHSKITVLFILLLSFQQSISAQCPSATNLLCPYNQNNGQRGVMFDIEAINGVTITCFDAALYSGTTSTYEIYYKTGTHQGFQNNAAAWTLIGTATGVTSNGLNVPTNIPIPVNVTIPAGQTYAFYVTNTSGGGVNYTNGVNYANIVASNADIITYEGTGKSYPFGTNFVTRLFNGHIHYVPEVLLPVELSSFKALAIKENNLLTWTTATETEIAHFEIERSKDGLSFEKIGVVEGAGNSSTPQQYHFEDLRIYPKTYYRLKPIDTNGTSEYSNVVVVEGEMQEILLAFPNPAKDQLTIVSPYAADFQLVDILGHSIKNIRFEQADTRNIDISALPNGVYYLVDTQLGRNIKIIKTQ